VTRKILAVVLVVATGVAALMWYKRIDIMLSLVKYKSERETVVAPNRAIAWEQGPGEPVAVEGERPPNVILILADDLGINDISTFGGGVAGGRVPTPNIDRLAAEGAVFGQAYAGNATCAPSRAMIMTGRYPTRTGFEFTPTPSGMGPAVNMIANSLGSGLPPAIFNEHAEAPALPYEEQGLPSSEVTIAEVLKAKGYHTVHIGKWHLGRGEGFKPNDQGSTVGLSVVREEGRLAEAVALAGGYSPHVLVERYVPGREITVAILGGDPLPVVEIVPQGGLYDYESKYTKGKSEYHCPADLPKSLAAEVQRAGVAAYDALGCRGYARVDFRLSPEDEAYCLEANTTPGMTEVSLVPMAALAAGVDFGDLLERILRMALE